MATPTLMPALMNTGDYWQKVHTMVLARVQLDVVWVKLTMAADFLERDYFLDLNPSPRERAVTVVAEGEGQLPQTGFPALVLLASQVPFLTKR